MNYDPLEECPFDESHRILRSRMAFHLTRCAKNHKNAKKKNCPFDVRHVVDFSDYQHHVETCPSRESVLHYTLHDENEQKELQKQMGILPVPGIGMTEAVVPNLDDESWDDGPEVKSYNPHANIENKPVVRNFIGGSKSEKKKFRENERRRLQQIENEQEKKEKQKKERMDKIAVNLAARKGPLNKVKEETDISEKETILRRPKKQSMNRSLMDNSESADTKKETQDSVQSANKECNKPSVVNEKPKYVSSNESNGAIPRPCETVIPSNIQSNTVSTIEECYKPASFVKETPKYMSNESNGAIPKRRNDAATPKSCWTGNPSTTLSFADALKKKSQKSSATPSLNKTLGENLNTFEENEKENISLNNSIVDKVFEDFNNIELNEKSFEKVFSKVNEEYISKKQKSADVSFKEENSKPRKLVSKRSNRVAAVFPPKE